MCWCMSGKNKSLDSSRSSSNAFVGSLLTLSGKMEEMNLDTEQNNSKTADAYNVIWNSYLTL